VAGIPASDKSHSTLSGAHSCSMNEEK
jgi:hypothetical protein